MHILWIEKYLLERCVFCLVCKRLIIQYIPIQMFVTLYEKMCAPYSSLVLCSVRFPGMSLCQIQQCATVFSEPIASVSSVSALRLKSPFNCEF